MFPEVRMFLLKPRRCIDWNGFKIQLLILFAKGREGEGGEDKLTALSLHQPGLDLLDHYINPISERGEGEIFFFFGGGSRLTAAAT